MDPYSFHVRFHQQMFRPTLDCIRNAVDVPLWPLTFAKANLSWYEYSSTSTIRLMYSFTGSQSISIMKHIGDNIVFHMNVHVTESHMSVHTNKNDHGLRVGPLTLHRVQNYLNAFAAATAATLGRTTRQRRRLTSLAPRRLPPLQEN